jgi:Chaperone of endosialidase
MKNLKQFLAVTIIAIATTAIQAQVKIGANPTTITANTSLEIEATNAQKVVVSKDKGYVGIGTNVPSWKLHTIETNSPNVFTSLIENKQTAAVTVNDIIAMRGLINFTGGFSGAGTAAGHSGEVSFGGAGNYTNGAAGYYTAYSVGSGTTNQLFGTASNVYNLGTGIMKRAVGLTSNVDNGIIQEGIGLDIVRVVASGTDASNPHNAYGIKINNFITASGGSTNNAWSIYSASTQPSYYAGKVGIGTETPQDNLHVAGIIGAYASSGHTGNLYAGTSNVDGTEMTSGGWISAQRSADYCLHLTKAVGFTGGGLAKFVVNGVLVGDITTNGTSTAFNTTSDARLKENINTYEGALAKLSQVKVYDYNYKADPSKKHQIGFLAQELNKVYPQAVTPGGANANTNPWTVDYSKVVPLLTKAIQEQQAQIEAQNAEIKELKKLVMALK